MSDKSNLKTYTICIKNQPDLVLPKLGDELASGYDVVSISDPEIVGEEILPGVYKNISYIQYRTGIYLNLTQKEEVVGFELDYGEYAKISMINEALENKIVIDSHLQCFVYPRSSITKYNLMLKNGIGTIDCSYRGEILLRYHYLVQMEDFIPFDLDKSPCFGARVNYDKIYKKGDKCAQLIFSEISPRIKFNVVEDLGETSRGANGFGSTGS